MGVISKMSALTVAHEREFKHVKYVNEWNEYKVYEAYNDGGVAYIGLPQVILVDKNNKARWATYDEIMAWNDAEDVRENYTDNYSTSNNLEQSKASETNQDTPINNVKTDDEIIEQIKKNIREVNTSEESIRKIKDLEERLQSAKKLDQEYGTDGINYKMELDQQRVVHFGSTINKPLNYLYDEKKKAIENWVSFLPYWEQRGTSQMDSSIYKMHLDRIFNAIFKQTEDEKCREEFEQLNKIQKCISSGDIYGISKEVNILKQMEFPESNQKTIQNESKTPEQHFLDSLKTPMIGLPEDMASMSLKELYDEKKRILDNWVHVFERKNNEELEKNAFSESLFYYLQFNSIVNEIMSRVDDENCKKEIECLDRIYKYIGQKNITELTSAFLDLSLIEYPSGNK